MTSLLIKNGKIGVFNPEWLRVKLGLGETAEIEGWDNLPTGSHLRVTAALSIGADLKKLNLTYIYREKYLECVEYRDKNIMEEKFSCYGYIFLKFPEKVCASGRVIEIGKDEYLKSESPAWDFHFGRDMKFWICKIDRSK